jgi:2,3-bisphosphoglycerate-dependent phosphoglycerate mutase
MELFIIRHGLPERVVVTSGTADPHLDALGQKQAEAVGEYVAAEGVDAIWSSPMNRAVETAAPLAKRTGLTVQTHDGLAEWDRNSQDYIPVEELKATNDPRWQKMMAGEWTGDQDPIVFQSVVVKAFDEIISAHNGEKVAVTCHGGVINTYLAHVLGLGMKTNFFHPEYTSIHRIMASSRGHRSLRSVNELTHLYGKDLLPKNKLY